MRKSGQLAHNDKEFNLFLRACDRKGVSFGQAVFDYADPDGQDQDASPPLSWHLTKGQVEKIKRAWDAQSKGYL